MMKQMQKKRNQKVSGFTLLEMVVVVAIVAILTGIMVPTVKNYITRSRVGSANSNAKVLFNSIQTLMLEYQFKERLGTESSFYGDAYHTLKPQNGESLLLYIKGVNGVIQNDTTSYKVVNGGDPTTVRTAAQMTCKVLDNDQYKDENALGFTVTRENTYTFGNRLSKLFTDYDSVAWVALVENYSVRGVACASSATNHYVGAYPLGMEERNAPGLGIGENHAETISQCSLKSIREYVANAWKLD